MKSYLNAAALAAAALCLAATGVVASAGPAAAAGQTGAPSDRLQVWNLNTHKMDTGSYPGNNPNTDYRQFVDYITDPAQVAYLPDIVTLQEAGKDGANSPTASCQDFVTALEGRTGINYNCQETTAQGGAAIVYRTSRLTYVGGSQKAVQLNEVATDSTTCSLSSWYALVLRLSDDLNPGHYVNAASVHLPVRNYPDGDTFGNDCSWSNLQAVSGAVDGLGTAAMKVMGGDWNHPDGSVDSTGTFAWECGYAGANVDLGGCKGTNLGWKDPMYKACGLTGVAAYDCLRTNHWTIGSSHNRIDFLLAKAYAIYNQVTVDWAAAYASAGSPSTGPTQYSDHRGQGALLRYS